MVYMYVLCDYFNLKGVLRLSQKPEQPNSKKQTKFTTHAHTHTLNKTIKLRHWDSSLYY